jgi:hypothetical protein
MSKFSWFTGGLLVGMSYAYRSLSEKKLGVSTRGGIPALVELVGGRKLQVTLAKSLDEQTDKWVDFIHDQGHALAERLRGVKPLNQTEPHVHRAMNEDIGMEAHR